jgi:glutamate dehydrogenase
MSEWRNNSVHSYKFSYNFTKDVNSLDVQKINDDILELVMPWEKKFISYANKNCEDITKLDKFIENLPEDYKKNTHYSVTLKDFNYLSSLNEQKWFDLELFLNKNGLEVRVYYLNKQFFLYSLLPILSNFEINVLNEDIYEVSPKKWVQSLSIEAKLTDFDFGGVKSNFETVLKDVLAGLLSNSPLNSLSITAALDTRKIMLLQAFIQYLQQIGFNIPQTVIETALTSNPKIVGEIVKYFYEKFEYIPGDSGAGRVEKLKRLSSEIDTLISSVSNPQFDRVLRMFMQLIDATVRTNFFGLDETGAFKDYMSFKINSSLVPGLPQPIPFCEIFVYSKDFEAIHLRGGKVARGGLRWSDRADDFRTEVLGLMKAQAAKNVIVVPVGAKGGFVIKLDSAKFSRDEWAKLGQMYYTKFLYACLDITDNVIDGEVQTPPRVVKYDENDPYIVAAADKGTATFSDLANSISAKYNFWLGDAFASGGSNGYDHKKMGITSKGAWIAVKRHFYEIGIDPHKDEFTCVGIGDMAGDVFGNGMLMSDKIRLIGAFNHMHIFIDPNPDAKHSYEERKRMFNLPRSSWADYDKATLSEGAMIYERSAKMLKLTKQIKDLFQLEREEIEPNELIKVLLMAQVDLIWNGGIGTYVKASTETHAEVGDKANDNLRINGCDLRAKIIGEGGNLGFTQRGRIEASKAGVLLNTDATDNSAGVDCSDHEVNMKITLNKLVKDRTITLEERNKMLTEMTADVEKLVLTDNKLQTKIISISISQSVNQLDFQADLMDSLEREMILNRKNEFLPSSEELTQRKRDLKGLTRPELSVLLSYSKIDAYGKIINSELVNDAFFDEKLLAYFPPQLIAKFPEELKKHQLRREIIGTIISNEIINRLGITFLHRVSRENGVSFEQIARTYYIVSEILNTSKLYETLENLEGSGAWQTQVRLYEKVIKLCEQIILWFIENEDISQPIQEIVETYKAFI